jgi:cyclase
MVKIRIIPTLVLQGGLLVRSERFELHQVIGNPVNEAARYSDWNVDEILYLDIGRGEGYDLRRDDHKVRGLESVLDILTAVSRRCFVPLTFGGRIRTLDDAAQRIANGADKVSLCTAVVDDPALLGAIAGVFGAQAVVACVDARAEGDGWSTWVDGGRRRVDGVGPAELARRAVAAGAGEVLVQSIDRDGTAAGFDLRLIETVAAAVDVPVIALGGCGTYEHLVEAAGAGASAVAAANLFHFKELSDRHARRTLAAAGVDVRT